jgi:CheY-like chemotaxis protein
MRAVAKKPDDRFATSAAFCAALRNATGHDSQEAIEIVGSDPDAVNEAVRVLIVDDDPHFARAISRAVRLALKDSPLAVAHTKNALAALKLAERWPPDLLLLDYHLPGMNGAELLSHIRTQPAGGEIAVLVMSGALSDRDRWPFSSLGVEHFLSKPDTPKHLRDAIIALGQAHGWLAQPASRFSLPPGAQG